MARGKYFFWLIFLIFLGWTLFSGKQNHGFLLTDGNEDAFILCLQEAKRNRHLGNYEEALLYYNKALDLAKEVKLRDEVLEAVEGKGIVLWNLGKMEEARSYFHQGYRLAREWNLPLSASFFETGLEICGLYQEGKIRRQKRDYAGAVASFERAIQLARKIRCPELELKCLRQASLVFYDQNEIDNFRLLNEKGLRMARLLNHGLEEGRFLNNIAIYYHLEKRNLSMTFNILNSASLLLEKKGEKRDIADCLYNLGVTIFYMGFYDRAIKYFQKALEIDKENNKENYILDLNSIGLCLLNKGKINNDLNQIKEALSYFKEALQLGGESNEFIKTKIMVLNNLANALFLAGEKQEALKYINMALKNSRKINDTHNIIIANDTLGSFYVLSEPERALKYLLEGLQLALNSRNFMDAWPLYYNIGRSYESLKEYNQAVDFYNKSINLIETVRRKIDYDFYQAGFLRNKQEVFDSMIRVKKKIYDDQTDLAHKEDLFSSVERVKARSFLSLINNSELNSEASSDDPEKDDKYIDLIRKMSNGLSRKESLEKTVESQFDLLRREDLSLTLSAKRRREDLGENSIENKCMNVREIQEKILDRETAILEYYLSDWGSLLIVITKNNFEIIDLPPKKQIEDSVSGYARLISNPPIKNISGEDGAHRIYMDLFLPAERWLSAEIKNLIIIPDGLLYCLPFEAMMKANGNSFDYLVKKYNMTYAPSVSALSLLKERERHREEEDKEILAIGDPQYKLFFQEKRNKRDGSLKWFSQNILFQNNLQISSLPFSKKEIKFIASLFPKEKKDVLLREKASEGVIKNLSLRYKIIHFACHGYIDEGFPFRSALILTPEPEAGNDGFLQAYEISNLKIRAKLVVLSACQSARGPLEKAEGLLSLNRVFFASGAKAVISSLWKVNDRASADFMAHFYRHLKQGKTLAQALREAKLKMLTSRFKHPFYWAGTVLSGDGLSILFPQK